jgi:hypothetical protein
VRIRANDTDYPRDFRDYDANLPEPKWPISKKLALSGWAPFPNFLNITFLSVY